MKLCKTNCWVWKGQNKHMENHFQLHLHLCMTNSTADGRSEGAGRSDPPVRAGPLCARHPLSMRAVCPLQPQDPKPVCSYMFTFLLHATFSAYFLCYICMQEHEELILSHLT